MLKQEVPLKGCEHHRHSCHPHQVLVSQHVSRKLVILMVVSSIQGQGPRRLSEHGYVPVECVGKFLIEENETRKMYRGTGKDACVN